MQPLPSRLPSKPEAAAAHSWGFLYARFAAASADAPGSLMARIGIGGHWMIAGCMRMAAGLVVSSIGALGKDAV